MLNQPSNISPDEVNGSGCIDAEENLTVAWQVSGTSAMTAYQVDICLNDAASTLVYSTGKESLDTPFWGTNYLGKTQYFSVEIDKDDLEDAGIENGREYKIVLTEWWAGSGKGTQLVLTSTKAAGDYNFAWDSGYINFNMPVGFDGVIGYSADKNIVYNIDNNGHFSTYTAEKSDTAIGTPLTGTDFTGGELWVTQSPESLFVTRKTPTLTLTELPDPLPYRSYSFTATYAQEQGDAINWVKWELAEDGDEDSPYYDSGEISGTGQLQMDYDGFFTGTRYTVRCTVETQNGIQVSTGWVEFDVYFSVSTTAGSVQVCQPANRACTSISWSAIPEATGYAVYRRRGNLGRIEPVANVPDDTLTMWDYGVKSGETYTYYVFPEGSNVYTQEPMVSEPYSYNFWVWAILCARMAEDGAYHMTAGYGFKMGVSAGSESNNNQPSVVKSFTRFPVWQTDNSNYRTGSVSGLINYTANAGTGYSDTADQADALAALSTTTDVLFLKDPKGNFRKIRTSAPISNTVNFKSQVMPQTMTVPWVEVGETNGIKVISTPGDDFFAGDAIVRTTLHIDLETGALVWTVPNNYSGGSDLEIRNGALIQNYDWTFTPAEMSLNANTGIVIAVI